MRAALPGATLQVAGAFLAIYLLWGGTYLAIRIAVLEMPPFLTAGVRFLVAGTLLYAFLRARGQPAPTALEWRNIAVASLSMFVCTYSALFWAEQYLPSGLTAVIEATLPLSTIALEVFVFRQQPFRWRTFAAVGLGFAGVAGLLLRRGEADIPLLPCLVVLAASFSWSLGAVLTRSMARPRSVALTAGAQMMVGGTVLLALASFSGEVHVLAPMSLQAAMALLYLIVPGSLVGFTAYVWLLARIPATRVASHAYVNPLVAVALGYFLAGEVLTVAMLVAAVAIVAGVFLILHKPRAPA
jgi:drug/metabolite transporter (DMT)-like permease